MRLARLPPRAAWRHHTAREATEVVALAEASRGWLLAGVVTGVEGRLPWALSYEIEVDAAWQTRSARVASLLAGAPGAIRLAGDGGRWELDGRHLPELDGVLDVDLEGSAMTNTLPVQRTGLAERTSGSAAYVRLDLSVQRLDQWYGPAVPAADGGWTVAYEAPEFRADFDLSYDASGLVVDYPGLATRIL